MRPLSSAEIRSKILFLLAEDGKNIKWLNEKIGLDGNNLYKVLSGSVQKIPADLVAKIAKALNVDCAYLLTDTTEEKKLPVSLNTVSAYLGISPSAVRFICSLNPEQLSGLDAILCSRSGFGDLLRIFGSEEAVDIDVLQYKASRITGKIMDWIRK